MSSLLLINFGTLHEIATNLKSNPKSKIKMIDALPSKSLLLNG